MSKPNFLYIGPDKAGSTWIFRILEWHPKTYITPSKDTLFFDKYYDRGTEWYKSNFSPSDNHKVIAEIGHNYLFSEEIAYRIKNDLGPVKLMVCLREPARRAYSAYLYLQKHDMYRGSFKQALDEVEELVEHGRYMKHLRPYLQTFGSDQIHVGIFDDLKNNPNLFAQEIFDFLGVERRELTEKLEKKSLPAARARSKWTAHLAKRAAWLFRGLGFPQIVGKVKTSPIVHRLLYEPYDKKPEPSPEIMENLRDYYTPTVKALDKKLGFSLQHRWGYEVEKI
ncbi:sulfotransferase domain-containing protein [Salinibacter sp.]|uniref:sulfotransferase domain-containing protein n=1 Tax=Salinibacter sp. TaxID=2065818 RepID=UPI0021E74F16|nr:sulfotransferase domain-containing protein [Salinibacter sp.]